MNQMMIKFLFYNFILQIFILHFEGDVDPQLIIADLANA